MAGAADGLIRSRFEPALGVDQVVNARAEDGVDFIVGVAELFAEDILGTVEDEI